MNSQAPGTLSNTSAANKSGVEFQPDSLGYSREDLKFGSKKTSIAELDFIGLVREFIVQTKAQNESISFLSEEVDHLERLSSLTRSDKIKESIEKVMKLTKVVLDNRSPLNKLMNVLSQKAVEINATRSSELATSGTQTEPSRETVSVPTQVQNVKTKNASVQTPCWGNVKAAEEPPVIQNSPLKGQRTRAKLNQRPLATPANFPPIQPKEPTQEIGAAADDFKIVTRKRARKPQQKPVDVVPAIEGVRRRRPPRTQAVNLKRPTDKVSYAEMLCRVKTAVQEEKLAYNIHTRRAKSGNIILEIKNKDEADNLATVIKTKLGDEASVRRPSPSILLLLSGIEHSVSASELEDALI